MKGGMRAHIYAFVVVAAAVLVREAHAQSYTVARTSGAFSTISSTGLLLTPSDADDGFAEVPSAFGFDFWGTNVPAGTPIYPSTNGLIAVGSPTTDYGNVSIPSSSAPNGFLAAFWDDLALGEIGAIYAHVQGSSGSRVQIIEWNNIVLLSTGVDAATFQVRVYEGSNVIEVIYGPSGGSSWSGTVGMESPLGDAGLSESCTPACQTADVAEGTVLRYTPSASPPLNVDLLVLTGESLPATVQAGSSHSVDWSVLNKGADSAGATSIAVFARLGGNPTTSDLELARGSVQALSAGGSASGTLTVTAPGTSGEYFLALIVDPDGNVSELSEGNNNFPLNNIVVEGSGSSIVVTTPSVPNGFVNEAYSVQLAQTGATSPLWTLDSGTLPAGLTLSSSGLISGTPSAEGTSSFIVRASESGLEPGTKPFVIFVAPADTIRLSTSTLPDALVGSAYTAMLAAAGGTPPYTFEFVSGAPSWLMLASNGALSGTPDASGTHQLRILLTDAGSVNTEGGLTLIVVDADAVMITSPETISVRINSDARVALLAQGGTPPYTWSLVQGALQAGLTIDPTGFITGRATMVSTATVTLQVSDMGGESDSATVFVKAENRAAPGGGGGGGGRDRSGCSCRADGIEPGSVLWLAVFALFFVVRRKR
jgi:MYXO-CTERM domain-containing protein